MSKRIRSPDINEEEWPESPNVRTTEDEWNEWLSKYVSDNLWAIHELEEYIRVANAFIRQAIGNRKRHYIRQNLLDAYTLDARERIRHHKGNLSEHISYCLL